jgi:hypothetical protein
VGGVGDCSVPQMHWLEATERCAKHGAISSAQRLTRRVCGGWVVVDSSAPVAASRTAAPAPARKAAFFGKTTFAASKRYVPLPAQQVHRGWSQDGQHHENFVPLPSLPAIVAIPRSAPPVLEFRWSGMCASCFFFY